jgi:hypothetical protein
VAQALTPLAEKGFLAGQAQVLAEAPVAMIRASQL